MNRVPAVPRFGILVCLKRLMSSSSSSPAWQDSSCKFHAVVSRNMMRSPGRVARRSFVTEFTYASQMFPSLAP